MPLLFMSKLFFCCLFIPIHTVFPGGSDPFYLVSQQYKVDHYFLDTQQQHRLISFSFNLLSMNFVNIPHFSKISTDVYNFRKNHVPPYQRPKVFHAKKNPPRPFTKCAFYQGKLKKKLSTFSVIFDRIPEFREKTVRSQMVNTFPFTPHSLLTRLKITLLPFHFFFSNFFSRNYTPMFQYSITVFRRQHF